MAARRWPLWTTLIPLVAGALLWAFLWNGYAQRFADDLAPWLPAGTAVETGGFPYRLQARVAPLDFLHEGAALRASVSAGEAYANRVPWQRQQTVFNLKEPRLRLDLAPLAGSWLTVDAGSAQASLRTDSGRIARLSAVWDDARLASGLLRFPVAAEQLEAHLRETPATAQAAGPRLPTQDQLVMSATGARLGAGAALSLALDAEITARGPVRSLQGWRDGGTVEIRSLTLTDTTGEVLRLTATIVPDGAGALRAAGTIETVCPASLRAAVAGQPHPVEQRTRKPVRMAFTASLPGLMELEPADPAKPPPPVRGQEPNCPRLV